MKQRPTQMMGMMTPAAILGVEEFVCVDASAEVVEVLVGTMD